MAKGEDPKGDNSRGGAPSPTLGFSAHLRWCDYDPPDSWISRLPTATGPAGNTLPGYRCAENHGWDQCFTGVSVGRAWAAGNCRQA